MAINFNNSTIGAFGNQMQLFGLGSKMDTQTILNAELQLIQLRNKPTYTLQTNLQKEKTVWETLKNDISTFQKLANGVKGLTAQNKQVTTSSEGLVSITADKGAIEGDYDIQINQLASAQRIKGDKQTTGALGIEETATLNGTSIDITAEMSLRDIALTISKSDAGVGAIVLDNQLVLTNKASGAANQMSFTGTAWDTLGVTDNGSIKNELQSATDASYSINGVAMTNSSNEIKDAEGITINLLKTTDAPLSFTVKPNAETALMGVKSLVEGYNKLIDRINTLSGENGPLQGERIPRNLKRAMTESVYQEFGSGYLFQTGIGLDSTSKNGHIKLDETAFTKFFGENPEEAMNIISGFGSKLSTAADRFASANGEITGETNALTSRLGKIDNQIDRFERDFVKQKDALVLKYAQFEVMMQRLSSQNDYLLAQMGQFEMDSKN